MGVRMRVVVVVTGPGRPTHVAPGRMNKIVIDIVDDARRVLAKRHLSPIPSAAESTLQFVVDGSDIFLAFRVFATGFAGGELRFGSVKLRPRRPH